MLRLDRELDIDIKLNIIGDELDVCNIDLVIVVDALTARLPTRVWVDINLILVHPPETLKSLFPRTQPNLHSQIFVQNADRDVFLHTNTQNSKDDRHKKSECPATRLVEIGKRNNSLDIPQEGIYIRLY